MPGNLAIGAFVLGAVLLLVSLLSGGFKIFGAEISGTTGKSGRVIAFILGLVFIVTGFSAGGSGPTPVVTNPSAPASSIDPGPSGGEPEALPEPEPPAVLPAAGAVRPRPASNVVPSERVRPEPAQAAASVRSLDFSWRDGTGELQQIFAQSSPDELAALSLMLSAGMDIYAFRVRITNTGSEPVAISPEDIKVHYGLENVAVTTMDDPRFLRGGRLAPGQFREGLVAFPARVDIGAAMRLGGGSLSYDDDSIEVTYSGR